MSGGQTKSSALTTALAFHYQVLIGLNKCFSLQESQAIWFEKDGDVSLLGDDAEQSTQIEVKNYSAPLTDHHDNLWNTLKNWVDPVFDHKKYGALILHTTQAFGATTRLKNWNTLTPEQRLNILNDIFSERIEEELNAKTIKDVVKHQKAVMSTEHDVLLEIVAKVTFFTEADDEDVLKEKIVTKFIGIPKNNHAIYLQCLVGSVYDQANQQSWQLQQSQFVAKCEELTAHFCRKEFTFPPFTGYEATDSDIKQYQEKLFVKKVNDIEHYEVISDAVGNWMELQNSLLLQLDEYPLYADKTKAYQEKIIKLFKLKYSSAQLESTDHLKSSKILYNQTIEEHPLNMGNDVPPIEYKNGLIHDAMDDEDRNLKWRIEL
jgi:hypothetical protein